MVNRQVNWNFHSIEVVDRVRFDKMEVNDFENLLIDVTFYLHGMFES